MTGAEVPVWEASSHPMGVAGLFAFLRKRYPEIVEHITQQPRSEDDDDGLGCHNLYIGGAEVHLRTRRATTPLPQRRMHEAVAAASPALWRPCSWAADCPLTLSRAPLPADLNHVRNLLPAAARTWRSSPTHRPAAYPGGRGGGWCSCRSSMPAPTQPGGRSRMGRSWRCS